MPVPMTPAQLAGYRATAERRRREEWERRAERRTRAWDAARLGAAILRERFGVSSVMVFGSLAGERWFGETSDVHLAASGLRADDYFTHDHGRTGLSDLGTHTRIEVDVPHLAALGLRSRTDLSTQRRRRHRDRATARRARSAR